MFSLGSVKAPYPTVYSVTSPKKSSKKNTPTSPPREAQSSPDSLEPAIDGPPSPERIRAYTEQMKRSSFFGNDSRTNTLSSGTSSSRSRESIIASTDNVSLTRQSSSRSTASSMLRHDRPESVQLFGSLFSRSSRKTKRETHIRGLRSVSSLVTSDMVVEEGSAKDHYYGRKNDSRRQYFISNPYNFQHITHTRQDHLPELWRASGTELVTEFSAIRASQTPTHGELKGIRAEDLHFENFSSEALSAVPSDEAPAITSSRTSPDRWIQRSSTKSPQREVGYTKSHDNLRNAPPRPPRSPQSPTCPITLPARTSSRTASVLFDGVNTSDPLASTTISRPHTNGGFRKPTPFNIPLPPPTWDERDQDGATTPGDDGAWPLTASPSGTFGNELADVQEEEEEIPSKRLSQISTTSAELRMSQSVPALRLKSQAQSIDRPENRRMSTTLGQPLTAATFAAPTHLQSPTRFQFNDSWESDIDWCYENGEESCDYEHCSEDGDTSTDSTATVAQPQLQLSLQTEERTYRGRFGHRPSLLVPSAFDAPELSPGSNVSTPSSDPRTPATFLRPNHIRSPSHASSFKESHGFHLSPSLLIPADYQTQMDQDAIYSEEYGNDSSNGAIFMQDSPVHANSPIDEVESSTCSYRSSDFSHGSLRSSSSTRASGMSRGSQDSMLLLRSIRSDSSLPDLVPSTLRQIDHDLSTDISALAVSDEVVESAPSPEIGGSISSVTSIQHRRNKSLVLERQPGNGETQMFPSAMSQSGDAIDVLGNLSPVIQAFANMPAIGRPPVHGRKTSAPEAIAPVRELKGRARASTVGGKRRGSYMLFPPI